MPSFDQIGSIIIFNEKISKDKAKSFLSKTIKSVGYKSKNYSGKLRLPKIKILAGENTKETLHKENGCLFKLNIEKCYFSVRSGSERLRVAKQVKDNESILVMFSGTAPMPLVIEKNSNPKEIYAIELNKVCHKYAKENLILNKSRKILLFEGDVRKIILNLGKEKIGLKSSPEELSSRLKQKPKVIELYLNHLKFPESFKKVERVLEGLNKKNIFVMIHSPKEYNKFVLNPASSENFQELVDYTNQITRLYKKYNNLLGFILHGNYFFNQKLNNQKKLIKNINALCKENPLIKDILFLENGMGCTFSKEEDVLEVLNKTKLKNICFDLAHYFCVYKTDKNFVNFINRLMGRVNVFFHIADSTGKYPEDKSFSDQCRIGEGKINFSKLHNLIDFGVIEVCSKNEMLGTEMINDYKKFIRNVQEKKFDRILMPLPKDSESYLNLALEYIKKKGIIHFYTFGQEKEIESIKKNILKHPKRIKIKQIVRCGNYAPYTFRLCFDLAIT